MLFFPPRHVKASKIHKPNKMMSNRLLPISVSRALIKYLGGSEQKNKGFSPFKMVGYPNILLMA
jgi:hypothetical protein